MLEDDDTRALTARWTTRFPRPFESHKIPLTLRRKNGEPLQGEYSPTEPPDEDGAAAEKPTQAEMRTRSQANISR